jgi:hypothetical protein
MESAAEFIFDPLPPIEEPAAHAPAGEPATSAAAADPLGPLAGLKGTWTGRGFNVIWRPRQRPGLPKQDHFLELNRTSEQLDFGPSLEKIPNRGLLQHAISLHGLNYLQQISDENLTTENHDSKQHFEPGLWMIVPQTSQPQEPQTVARLACIPHGTTFLAQGTAHTSPGAPSIPDISIRPFPIGEPRHKQDFPEQHLEATGDLHRTSGRGLVGIRQEWIDNPNSLLTQDISDQQIQTTTRLHVSTSHAQTPGSGTRNIAFLTGVTQTGAGPPPAAGLGPNAVTAHVTATFWVETLEGKAFPGPHTLQYSQLVLLNFDGFSWPHVTVATLHKTPPVFPPPIAGPG